MSRAGRVMRSKRVRYAKGERREAGKGPEALCEDDGEVRCRQVSVTQDEATVTRSCDHCVTEL